MIGPAVVDQPINSGSGEATEKTTPDVSTGTGSVAPGNSANNGEEAAGGSQENAEGGREDGAVDRRRGPTKMDTIRELRARNREMKQLFESKLSSLEQRLEQLGQTRSEAPKPARTFWDAPDEFIESRMKALEDRFVQTIQQGRQVDEQTSEWRQETDKATEFIRTQGGLTPDDEDEIVELIQSTPTMKHMRPMERAEYALYLFNKQKGITDKSALKAKASSTQGAPPSASKAKIWTRAEYDKVLDDCQTDPKKFTPELEAELMAANKEGRVK